MFRLALLAIAGLLFLSISITPAQANNLVITTSVPAKPTDFQLEFSAEPSEPEIGAGQVVTYTATYGSHLAQPTDMIVIIATWQQQPDSPNIIDYLVGSATTGLGGAEPVINLRNKTITWTITPVPPGLDHQVSWQLIYDQHRDLSSTALVTVNTKLIGPGVQVVADPISKIIIPKKPLIPIPTPTPGASPISPPTVPGQPAPTPGPGSGLQPSITPTPTPDQTIPSPTPPVGKIDRDPIITPVGTISNATLTTLLGLLLLLTTTLFYRWLQRSRILHRLYLLARNKTIIYGKITYQHQPLRQHLVQIVQYHDNQINHLTTIKTDPDGYYQATLSHGSYSLTTEHHNQALKLLELKVKPHHSGHYLERNFNLRQRSTKPNKPAPKT